MGIEIITLLIVAALLTLMALGVPLGITTVTEAAAVGRWVRWRWLRSARN